MFEAGYPVWYIRGYKYMGLNEAGELTYQKADGTIDTQVDTGDMVMLGQGSPKLTFGLNI